VPSGTSQLMALPASVNPRQCGALPAGGTVECATGSASASMTVSAARHVFPPPSRTGNLKSTASPSDLPCHLSPAPGWTVNRPFALAEPVHTPSPLRQCHPAGGAHGRDGVAGCPSGGCSRQGGTHRHSYPPLPPRRTRTRTPLHFSALRLTTTPLVVPHPSFLASRSLLPPYSSLLFSYAFRGPHTPKVCRIETWLAVVGNRFVQVALCLVDSTTAVVHPAFFGSRRTAR